MRHGLRPASKHHPRPAAIIGNLLKDFGGVRLPAPTGVATTELWVRWLALKGAPRDVGARVCVSSNRFPGLAFMIILAPLGLVSCGGHASVARSQQCREPIVLSLSPGVGHSPRVVDDVADDAGVKLEYMRSTTPNLFVYGLSARGADPGCAKALSRLREDSRVRFAEPERRRASYGFDP